jgi:hypothetical protein
LIELVLFWQRREQGLYAKKGRKRPVKFLRFFPPLPVPWQAEKGIQQELFLEILSNTFTVSESQKVEENSDLHNTLAH